MSFVTRRATAAIVFASTVLAFISLQASATAGDWPQWRYDAQRSAASPDELPAKLQLHWVRELPKLKPAWLDQPKMQFDATYEPIVVGQRLLVGSSHDNSVTAYDTKTGSEAWRYFADGPVRFAPLAWDDKLYVASDDGYLHCLKLSDGSIVWKFRGGPSDRKLLGNERLISTWPVRGAPVIANGKVFFAAGIWPFMGIFMHALDAQTGEVVWTNDGDGSTYMKQPHNTDSFAGVAPQGPLVAIGDKLLIPGGRSVPACYDQATGQMLHYALAENAKRGGGSAVAAVDGVYFNGGGAFDVETGKSIGSGGELVTFADGGLFAYEDGEIRTLDLKSSNLKVENTVDRKGEKTKSAKWTIREQSSTKTPKLNSLIKAGSRLYAGEKDRLLAWSLPLPEKDDAKAAWEAKIEGTPTSLIAADDKLFAVTLEGSLYCFGAASDAPKSPVKHELPKATLALDDASSGRAESILKSSGVSEGYCVVFGASPGGLITELARQSQLKLIVVEADAKIANALRTRLQAANIGADRITVLVAKPAEVALPPYLASLMVANDLPASEADRAAFIARAYDVLRPFGGTLCIPDDEGKPDSLAASVERFNLANAAWKLAEQMAMLVREGALPESADWTHEHADAANSRVSKDKRVKAPLGLLWFGGPPNDVILPRHGHGPQPQVVEGRLFIEGMDLIRATDIYTGRLLWEAKLPGLGTLYDNTAHQPGANAAGTNYIATPDGIYVAYGKVCLKLDPATGKQQAEFKLPTAKGAKESPTWGYINVFEDYLVGGAEPLFDPSLAKSRDNDNYSSSKRLFVLDRRSGTVLWSADARSGFRHNGVCIGGGRLYCIDRLSGHQVSRLKRRGEEATHKPRLLAFDLKTGKELWSTEEDVFGTWLSYSVERDVLVEAGRTAKDTLSDEAKGMRAYLGDSGSVLWENKSYLGPAMIHHDNILMAGSACELLTGKPMMRAHPISGESVEWTWSRNYGCNTPMASEHLLTFRSGAAGYFDFCNDGGTGNFGGFRSSCSNNLVVAGGLLNAPDYTRTCVCSYQNQTSLALVPMPEIEIWTSFGSQTSKQPVRRLGINLGAPGDRKAEDGTLWLEYPSVGGSSPEVSVKLSPETPDWFRRHSSQIEGDGLSWVAASGLKGLTSIEVKLADSDSRPRTYTVRLHFAEPDDVQPGERTFGVSLQGKKAIESLDVVKEAGGRYRSLVKEFKNIEVGQDLRIELSPDRSAKLKSAVLCGIEIQAQGW